eukprot:TRINITY_DN16459_c0_g1_i15.p1 TRINITY_DN16459_c0_g1~~TRINITY_DN16459_c0_g1_i15.p1  ORF type:complete len:267 (+),score=35.19 TRINITY_DN16459_c0_g1_i15:1186-1986(+)
MASARRRNNRITSLVDGDVRLSERENIVNHIKDFFATLYAKEEWDIPALDNLQFDSIGEVNAAYLESEFEEAEVREAVFALGGDKALGPDGFPIAFFHRFRHTLKEDIMAFLTEFHLRGKLPNNIGASFITLIPKKQGADRLKDFRPISLIGSIYKILAKVLAARLKIMPTIISQSQGAFVHGRQIFDGVLIANKCLHLRHKDKLPGVLCKIDLENAYDRVDWYFLSYLMSRMGFGIKWKGWILMCVSSARFSIMVNGSPNGYFAA